MGKGCGGGRGPGERGARAPQGGGRARDAAPGVRTRARRELAAAARPVPPRLILGGVERPKRRTDRLRGGEREKKKKRQARRQLQKPKPRGAAPQLGAGRTGRAGRRRRARGVGRGPQPGGSSPVPAAAAPALPLPRGSRVQTPAAALPGARRAAGTASSRPLPSPARPSPLEPSFSAGAHTAPLLGPLLLPGSPPSTPRPLPFHSPHLPAGLSLSPNPPTLSLSLSSR